MEGTSGVTRTATAAIQSSGLRERQRLRNRDGSERQTRCGISWQPAAASHAGGKWAGGKVAPTVMQERAEAVCAQLGSVVGGTAYFGR